MKISTQSLIPSKEDLLATKTSHFSTFIASELITILLELTYHFMNKCVLVQGPYERPILPQYYIKLAVQIESNLSHH